MKIKTVLLVLVLIWQACFVEAAPAAGALIPIAGSPFATGSLPTSVAISPLSSSNEMFVAAVNAGGFTASMYTMDQTTGSLLPVSGSPFSIGVTPQAIAFSPATPNLFVAVANVTISQTNVFSVDPLTGVLNPVPGSPFSTSSQVTSVQFSPIISGNLFAMLPSASLALLDIFQVDQNTGTFTPVSGSPFSISGFGPAFAAFSPIYNGKLFAGTANGSGDTSVCSVNPISGSPTEVPGSPFPCGTLPRCTQFSPVVSGNLFAGVVNSKSNSVSVFSVDPITGTYTEVPGSQFSTGASPGNIAFSPLISGHLFAAVTNIGDNNVTVFSVDQTTGVFTEIAGSPFSTGVGRSPVGIAYSSIVAGGLFVTVTNSDDDTVSVFQVFIPLPPIVTSISPNQGPVSGGTIVTIQGTNFTDTSAVNFGLTPATSFIVDSDTQITAISPPGTGTVDVTVTTPGGTSATSPADQFTYIAPINMPQIIKISPSKGPSTGGTVVRITGLNFTGATAVRFGNKNAQSFNVISDTVIEAVSPSGKNTVNIRVITPGGTSPVTPADQFTFLVEPLPFPPTNASGFQTSEKFATQTDIINVVSWNPPAGGTEIVTYKIFRDSLNHLIAVVPASKLQYLDHNRHKNTVYTYYIVSVDAAGKESSPAIVSINP